jgi:hypothetical protein
LADAGVILRLIGPETVTKPAFVAEMVTVAVPPPFFLTVSELALAVSLHPPGPVPVIGVEVPVGVVLQSTVFG